MKKGPTITRKTFNIQIVISAEGGGFEPPVQLPVRQFSKLLVSATHPSLQNEKNKKCIFFNAPTKICLYF